MHPALGIWDVQEATGQDQDPRRASGRATVQSVEASQLSTRRPLAPSVPPAPPNRVFSRTGIMSRSRRVRIQPHLARAFDHAFRVGAPASIRPRRQVRARTPAPGGWASGDRVTITSNGAGVDVVEGLGVVVWTSHADLAERLHAKPSTAPPRTPARSMYDDWP